MSFVRWAASKKMTDLNFIVDVWPKPSAGNTKLIVKQDNLVLSTELIM